MLALDRSICNNLNIAQSKEWLVTNGIGGYASGTVANVLTRRYHGLLIAATHPPSGRTLMATKFDETVNYDGFQYPLFANRWVGDVIEPDGFIYIEKFRLEGAIPVWTFAIADALIEKRIWMQPGSNTTYIQYRLTRAAAPLNLKVKALVNYRDHHSSTNEGALDIEVKNVENGLRITASDSAVPYQILSQESTVLPGYAWYRNYELDVERYRGLASIESNLYAGEFQSTLQIGESVCFIISTESNPNLDGNIAIRERRTYEENLCKLAPALPQQLCLAADQFIVRRFSPANPDGLTIIAGYPWFGDWGRDTMISLPGLTLATGRQDVALNILLNFSQYVSQGMLPNRFPDTGEELEYNTVDATLWYFEAIRAYVETTKDISFLSVIFPVLAGIIDWHLRGTRYNIHADPVDGLLYAGEEGVQLTWMDAKVGDWVVTRRMGKPVEINALWYNALLCMTGFAELLNLKPENYMTQARKVKKNFQRFWNNAGGYLFDGIDGPNGSDVALRPNQLFAVSLPHSPLNFKQQKAIVDVCALHLLTPHGLRSLTPDDPAYIGHYGGDISQRDGAYHQGTVWAWLIGPFVSAHLRVYQDPRAARKFIDPLLLNLSAHGFGSISEIFDGDAPFAPRGCFAQAWSVGEILRVYKEIRDFKKRMGVEDE